MILTTFWGWYTEISVCNGFLNKFGKNNFFEFFEIYPVFFRGVFLGYPLSSELKLDTWKSGIFGGF